MRSTIDADLSTSQWDSIGVDTASVRATLNNGLAGVQRLYAARLACDGVGIGHIRTHARTNGHARVSRRRRFARRVESLDPEIGDGQGARRAPPSRRGARHSTRQGRLGAHRSRDRDGAHDQRQAGPEARGQRAEVGAGGHVLGLGAYAEGTLSGNIYEFDLRGRAAGAKVVARGNFVRRFASEYAWMNARTPQAKVAIGVDADSVSAMGFAFDTVNVRATYSSAGGHVELVRGSGPESRLRPEGRLRDYFRIGRKRG